MKFKIDENLPIDFVNILRKDGHKAKTVAEQNLQGKEDSVIIEKCSEEGYILVSLDLGLSDIRAYPPNEYSGLLIFRALLQDKNHLIDMLRNIMPKFKEEPIDGKLWIVEETRIRIRGEE